jgi:tRNA (mo5U34)-methyltransferase
MTQTTALTAQAKREAIAGIHWWHTIDLGDGVITPGKDNSPAKLERLQMPVEMRGKSFLDIGAWDGFFSFAAEKRGSTNVLATDKFVWEGNLLPVMPRCSKEGFLTARALLNSKVRDMNIDPFEMAPENVGVFDVVLLAGVIYHVKHPWLLIEKVAAVTGEMLILETATDCNLMRRPAVALYRKGELGGDDTNWCGPNIPALRNMLLESGFKSVKVIHKTGLGRAVLSAGRRLWKYSSSPAASFQQERCVVHAFK